MFKFISFVLNLIFAYYLAYSWYDFNQAHSQQQGIENIVYYGIRVMFWGMCIVGNFVAMFSGTEIYVTQREESESSQEN